MKHITKFLFMAALTAAIATSAPIESRAAKAGVVNPSAAFGGPTQQGSWGAAMRSVCRAGISYGGILPGSPWAPITYGSCTLALLDAIF
jgi:hypothetical protein